jgi:DNA-3-methyladenine glycosylase II
MKFELLSEGPYNLTRSAWVLGQLPSDGTDVWTPARETLPAEYRRLHIIDDQPTLVIVQQEPSPGEQESRLLVHTHPARPRNFSSLRERVCWQFHLDAPLQGFYNRARKHPVFRFILKNLYGVKPLRPSTLFEMAVIAISEQQLSYLVAVKMRSRLVEALGKKMVFEGKEYRAFPTPEPLAECTVNDLRALSFSTRKAEYIIDLSSKVASGGFDIEALRDRPNEEIMDALISLRGFGRWSAEYFLARGLGRSEVVAGDDLGVQTLVGKYLGSGHRVTEKECRKIMEEWGPYKRWVVFYLFLASRLGLLDKL